MADKKVILLTGEIQSGKTTSLLNWIQKRTDTAGILTPVENGRRNFLSFPGTIRFEMEAAEAETGILQVGRFRFSAINFERAINILKEQLQQPQWKYVLIDEIGPLELKSKSGFWPVISQILQGKHNSIPVLVVRKQCCDELTALFKQNDFAIAITGIEDFENILK